MERLSVHRLGRVEYEDGLALMAAFGRARQQGLVPDTLLLLEHPPVVTLGRGAKAANIVAPAELLAARGVEVHETSRGGDVTYHGPGQLVGYPIFQLQPGRQDVRRYVRDVEESLIRALARLGVTAGRIPRWPGVWLGEEGAPDARKIAAIGVHISRWLTSHGFALNVRPDLSHFRLIVPCGIREAGVTSLERELPWAPSMAEVEGQVAQAFAEVFDKALSLEPPPSRRTVAVAAVDEAGRVLLLRRTEARGGFWQPVTGTVQDGESPEGAASRELFEETGLRGKAEPLGYRHAFALGERLPPELVEETGYWVRWPRGAEVVRSPEHDAAEWVTPEEARARLPFKGLKRVVELAAASARSG